MTQRCVRYISTPYVRDTFTKLSEHIGCDDARQSNLLESSVVISNLQRPRYGFPLTQPS